MYSKCGVGVSTKYGMGVTTKIWYGYACLRKNMVWCGASANVWYGCVFESMVRVWCIYENMVRACLRKYGGAMSTKAWYGSACLGKSMAWVGECHDLCVVASSKISPQSNNLLPKKARTEAARGGGAYP